MKKLKTIWKFQTNIFLFKHVGAPTFTIPQINPLLCLFWPTAKCCMMLSNCLKYNFWLKWFCNYSKWYQLFNSWIECKVIFYISPVFWRIYECIFMRSSRISFCHWGIFILSILKSPPSSTEKPREVIRSKKNWFLSLGIVMVYCFISVGDYVSPKFLLI